MARVEPREVTAWRGAAAGRKGRQQQPGAGSNAKGGGAQTAPHLLHAHTLARTLAHASCTQPPARRGSLKPAHLPGLRHPRRHKRCDAVSGAAAHKAPLRKARPCGCLRSDWSHRRARRHHSQRQQACKRLHPGGAGGCRVRQDLRLRRVLQPKQMGLGATSKAGHTYSCTAGLQDSWAAHAKPGRTAGQRGPAAVSPTWSASHSG